MLQTISKHIQGWIAGVVVAIVAAAFVLFGLEYYLTSNAKRSNAVASINGIKITDKQFNAIYDSLQRNYTQQGGQLDDQAQAQLRNMALQQLISDQVMLQTADNLGFSISMDELKQEVLRIPVFQENGQFSPQKFQQILASNGLTPEQFLSSLQGSLLIEQLGSGIRNSAFVTQRELARVYALLNQKRSFGYFILPAANFSQKVPPNDDQINAYYQQHQEDFRVPEQVKAAYLLLTPQDFQSEVKITPEELQQYYQQHTAEYTNKSFEAVKADIEKILSQQKVNQLMASKSEQLENLTYTNPSTLEPASKDLGIAIQTTDFMSKQGLKNNPLFQDPKVLNALFSDEVYKQNNNSEAIELKDGSYLVLRVAEKRATQIQPLAEIHDQIKDLLQKQQAQKEAGLRAYQIQQALEQGQPAALAKRYQLQWIDQNDVTLEDKKTPEQILGAAFNLAPSSDPSKKSTTSILLNSGDYAIIQLGSVKNADIGQASAQEKAQISNELASRWGEITFALFERSSLDKAKIKRMLK
ncbi:MAG: SurA N-terminal domain-containing protein [Proteobacteria bacterium]|nr:SurA N-terminal domain-containing protein [Pseudomonadota bacterium]